jgi:hypothetical protein
VYVFPAKAIPGAPNLPSSYVGGFIVLVRSSKSGWTTNTFHKDKSGFGMYIGIDLFHTSGRRVRVIGTYLPCHNPRSAVKKTKQGDEPSPRSQVLHEDEAELNQDHTDEVVPLNSSMEEKVMSYVKTLPNSARFSCARDWYWHQVNPLLAQASWEHIVMGDFNNRWPLSSPSTFQQECALQGLQNHLATALTERGISTKTFYWNFLPWSDLDHILTTLPSEAQTGGGILNHASWWIHGPDHMPIWASYRLPKHEAVQRTPWQVADRKLKIAIGRSNDKVVEEIQSASRVWLEQHPPPEYTDPLNLVEREERLKSLQESLRAAV